MPSVITRMRQLRARLVTIRCGLGAAVFPPDVKRLVLSFNNINRAGHIGPRKFWKNYLPRVQYHNPNVQIEVIRRNEDGSIGGPATLAVFTTKSNDQPKHTIDARHRQAEDIIKELITVTRAVEQPTSEEDAQILPDAQEVFKVKQAREARGLRNRQANNKARKEKEGTKQVVTDDVFG